MSAKAAALAILALCLRAVPAYAVEPKVLLASDVRALCASDDERQQETCKFYLLGITSGLMMGQAADANLPRICAEELTGAELRLVFLRISKELFAAFPSDAQGAAGGAISAILARAYRCHTN